MAPPLAASPGGSTLESTWGDPDGEGRLRPLPGEALVEREELGDRAAPAGTPLATFAHLTDAHVLDASSPARAPFLARLGPPFGSTFRPQEALTVPVLAGAVRAIRALAPDFVIQGGDLIDNAQANELSWALGVLAGGTVTAASGVGEYCGVQLAANPDRFYYRPDLDPPPHPGLLAEAVRPVASEGVGCPVLPVLGDHDVLVAGEIVPNPLTQAIAMGERALWTLPDGVAVPEDLTAGGQELVAAFLAHDLSQVAVSVPADAGRRQLAVPEVVDRLASPPVTPASSGRLDYVLDIGERLRVVAVDLAARSGGSDGLVAGGQVEFVSDALAGAGERWVLFACHQTLRQTAGGRALQAVLDASPNVILVLNGHTHHNRIRPRRTGSGGHWEIETSSLIDWPQQARALRLFETAGGGLAIQTWMLDHVLPGPLGTISRELAHRHPAGGRPGRFAGTAGDRNAVLYLRPPSR